MTEPRPLLTLPEFVLLALLACVMLVIGVPYRAQASVVAPPDAACLQACAFALAVDLQQR